MSKLDDLTSKISTYGALKSISYEDALTEVGAIVDELNSRAQVDDQDVPDQDFGEKDVVETKTEETETPAQEAEKAPGYENTESNLTK